MDIISHQYYCLHRKLREYIKLNVIVLRLPSGTINIAKVKMKFEKIFIYNRSIEGHIFFVKE